MRKNIRQMVENHYPGIKFANYKEMSDAHKLWKWETDGLIAINTASIEYGELAYLNGCTDDQYMLINPSKQ